MKAKQEEYAVDVNISGKATVFTQATSEEEAIANVNSGNFHGGEMVEWGVEEAVSAEVNK